MITDAYSEDMRLRALQQFIEKNLKSAKRKKNEL